MFQDDSMTVNMVVQTKTDKYRVSSSETSVELIRQLINNQDFTAKFIPASFTDNSTGTLILTEKP